MKPFTAVVATLAVGVALGAGADAAAAKPRGHLVSAITAALRTHDIYIERGTSLRPATRRKLVASARKHHLRLVILRRLPRGAKTLAGAAMQIAARLDDGIVAVAMRGRKIATAPLASATVAHARTRIGKRRGAAALLAFARAVHPTSGAAARAHPASAGGSAIRDISLAASVCLAASSRLAASFRPTASFRNRLAMLVTCRRR